MGYLHQKIKVREDNYNPTEFTKACIINNGVQTFQVLSKCYILLVQVLKY